MNNFKNITDWPAADNSADWNRNTGGLRGSFSQKNNVSCPTCNVEKAVGLQNNITLRQRVLSNSNQLSKRRSSFRRYRLTGKDVIESNDFLADGRAYIKYQLEYEDVGGNYISASPGALPGCGTFWTLQGGGNMTAFISRDRVSSNNPNIEYDPVDFGTPQFLSNSDNNGNPITSIYLFVEDGIRRNVTIDLNITNCPNFEHDGFVSKTVNIYPLAVDVNYPPPPPMNWSCRIRDFSGPDQIQCGQSAIYQVEGSGGPNPNHQFNFEISKPGYWTINQINSNSIELIPPSYRDIIKIPDLQYAVICVTMIDSNSNCVQTTSCKLIRVDCSAISYPGPAFDPDSIGSIEIIDWPAIPNINDWPAYPGIRRTDITW